MEAWTYMNRMKQVNGGAELHEGTALGYPDRRVGNVVAHSSIDIRSGSAQRRAWVNLSKGFTEYHESHAIVHGAGRPSRRQWLHQMLRSAARGAVNGISAIANAGLPASAIRTGVAVLHRMERVGTSGSTLLDAGSCSSTASSWSRCSAGAWRRARTSITKTVSAMTTAPRTWNCGSRSSRRDNARASSVTVRRVRALTNLTITPHINGILSLA